jgi:uncharacterized protein YggL (DUF469 family)
MAITKKQCAWPECKKEFHGTERKEYCGNTCKNKQWRLDKKSKEISKWLSERRLT